MKTITFGYGPTNEAGNDYEPIDWIVLSEEKGTLLISKSIIFCSIYDPADGTTWEDCELRKNLNRAFLQRFTLGKQDFLPVGIGPCGGDRVTILSMKETEKYLPAKELRSCEATPYAKKDSEDCCWLRVEKTHRGMSYLCTDGVMVQDDYGFPGDMVGVRPVIRIR